MVERNQLDAVLPESEAHFHAFAKSVIEKQEEEYARTDGELHRYIDELTLISVYLDRFRQNLSQDEVGQEIETARKLIKDLLREIRTSHRM